MQKGFKIAIGGKGGVGKTSICAVWAQLFADKGFDVLAIDADPNATLASAFGIPVEQGPEPLIHMKELISERTGTGKDATGAYFRLNPKVSDLPDKYWVKVGGLKLLVLGGINQAGMGCACPEGAFLKALLSHTILGRKEMVLVDLAAGVEFMGRASIEGIDVLVVVVEPGIRSITTANTIAKMGRQLGVQNIGAIANKITEPSQLDVIKTQLKDDIILLGTVKYSQSVQQADLRGDCVVAVGADFVKQLAQAQDKLVTLVSGGAKNIGEQCEKAFRK